MNIEERCAAFAERYRRLCAEEGVDVTDDDLVDVANKLRSNIVLGYARQKVQGGVSIIEKTQRSQHVTF
jgi:hypothetical protein